jgi:hypothetical protein
MPSDAESDYNTKVATPGYNDRYRNVAYITQSELANKPYSTTVDARAEDVNTAVDQQKILFAVATVTATTFLISAIFLAND